MRGEPVFSVPKREPSIVGKIVKKRKVVCLDRAAKDAVRKRDCESCRICMAKSRDVHERVFKSVGGRASLDNSLVLCRRICHALVQQHAVKLYGSTCNKPIQFEMTQAVAVLIFGSRPTPSHVTVL